MIKKVSEKLNKEEKKIVEALKTANGNKTLAAELLDIPRTTFRDKVRKLEGKIHDVSPDILNTPEVNAAEVKIIERALSEAGGNKSKAADLLGIPRTTFLDRYKRVEHAIQGFYRKPNKATRYVITAAQNATPIHEEFFDSIKHYCKHNNAELIIIPFRYKNPTSLWTFNNMEEEYWDDRLFPYLSEIRHDITNNLMLMADNKIQPTAKNPLSGYESISKDKSAIFAHTKVMMKVIPVPNHATPKIITTTGAITLPNYTDTAVGKKGEFHHSFAAVVVEIADDIFHLRHINAKDDGSFIDLNYEYSPDGVTEAPPAEALIMGDVHAQFVDEQVLKATFEDKDSIANTLQPKYLVWHDVLDFYSQNHHHRGDPFIPLAKFSADLSGVEKEIKMTFDLVNKYSNGRINVFPASNHPDALSRWIKETDWRTADPENKVFYLKTALYMAENTTMGGSGAIIPDPFVFWGNQYLKNKDNVFLDRDKGFVLHDIDIGSHGDLGANGGRGSIVTFSRLGVKTVTGHSHTPGIYEGAYQVGTSSKLRLGYNKGPSSWLQTHCVIYANGKRALLTIIKGKYKA